MPLIPSSRIIVTGGDGFLGRKVVARLVQMGHKPIVWDLAGVEDFGEIHGIIHMAAVSRVKDAEADPLQAVRTNCSFTAQTLQLAKQRGCWFLLLHTQEEGKNFYGLTKQFAFDYAKMFCQKNGMKLSVVSPNNVWGPGDNPDRLVPKMMQAARNGETLDYDRESLTLMHSSEVVDAIVDAMGTDKMVHMIGDKIRLKSLDALFRYVVSPDAE